MPFGNGGDLSESKLGALPFALVRKSRWLSARHFIEFSSNVAEVPLEIF